MSKTYKCDSCGEIIADPHNAKMKEFYLGWVAEIGDIHSHPFTKRVKIHLCDKCFHGLRTLAEKAVTDNAKHKRKAD